MELELAPCLDGERDAILRAVRVELGVEPSPAGDPGAIEVRVACLPDGPDAGVIVEVHRPDSPRRYRYALDWRAQPGDARPRLVGLAVAEAVDASRIELTALPEPAAIPSAVSSRGDPAAARRALPWSFAIGATRRAFTAQAGVALLGLAVMSSRQLALHLRATVDLAAEADTVLVSSGAIGVVSMSSAPRLTYRVGDRLHAELGLGARIGIVTMRGETLANTGLMGSRLVRAWLGPIATAAAGFELWPRVTIEASFELGAAASGVTARDTGVPAAALDGAWTSFGLAAAIAL